MKAILESSSVNDHLNVEQASLNIISFNAEATVNMYFLHVAGYMSQMYKILFAGYRVDIQHLFIRVKGLVNCNIRLQST